MSVHAGPEATEAGLMLSMDAGNVRSYPGSGSVITDLSVNKIVGTLSHTGAYNSGSGGHILVTPVYPFDTNYLMGDVFTVEVVMSKVSDGAYWSGIWGSEIWNTAEGYISYFDGRNTLTFSRGGGSGMSVGISDLDIFSFQHYIFTRLVDGTSTISVNGKLVASGSIPISTAPVSKTLVLGCRHTNDGSGTTDYGGTGSRIAMCRAYNRALTQAEIKQNFQSIRGRYGL